MGSRVGIGWWNERTVACVKAELLPVGFVVQEPSKSVSHVSYKIVHMISLYYRRSNNDCYIEIRATEKFH